MTELEIHLSNAFESLQQQHEKQHSDFVTTYNSLVQMFETTSKENASLRQQVSNLSEQINSLNKMLRR